MLNMIIFVMSATEPDYLLHGNRKVKDNWPAYQSMKFCQILVRKTERFENLNDFLV